jgi:hypothetical protein
LHSIGEECPTGNVKPGKYNNYADIKNKTAV